MSIAGRHRGSLVGYSDLRGICGGPRAQIVHSGFEAFLPGIEMHAGLSPGISQNTLWKSFETIDALIGSYSETADIETCSDSDTRKETYRPPGL